MPRPEPTFLGLMVDVLNNLLFLFVEQFQFPARRQYDGQRWRDPEFQDEALGHQLVWFILNAFNK